MSELPHYGHDTHPIDERPVVAFSLGEKATNWFADWRKWHYDEQKATMQDTEPQEPEDTIDSLSA